MLLTRLVNGSNLAIFEGFAYRPSRTILFPVDRRDKIDHSLDSHALIPVLNDLNANPLS